VRFAQLIARARNACVPVDKDAPTISTQLKLVHIAGTTYNNTNLCDKDFGVVAQDSYRLKRKVEMYQWQETFHEAQGSQRAYYTYFKVWSETAINSSQFKNPGFDNPPPTPWPFTSKALPGKEVMLGQYQLNASQVARLGAKTNNYVMWGPSDVSVLYNASQKMKMAGYTDLKPKGSYLVANAEATDDRDAPHIGQMRISFTYDKCAEATILAQQISCDGRPGSFTFRAWNPKTAQSS